ncbi:MAG: PfkB family carbohydrate kinase, partial [Gallionellaceae bacterium]|nr:PfkB family carbohydrate kinase [Gallionellaceae bacterium]
MSLFRDQDVLHEPTQAREVFDVSGAGDTVIATLAVMLASGADMGDAVRIANRAAGVVVGKLGTAVVTREEILQDMKKQD